MKPFAGIRVRDLDREHHPAYDVVIQAFAGVMAANGDRGSPPTRIGPPMVDYGTGAQAALAISAALFQRQQTGLGQHIDVSMTDSALMMISAMVVDTSITGAPPPAHGNVHSSYAGYATFETADGQLMVGAWTNEQLSRLLDVFVALPVMTLASTNPRRGPVGHRPVPSCRVLIRP